jgi:hypothetical protein
MSDRSILRALLVVSNAPTVANVPGKHHEWEAFQLV